MKIHIDIFNRKMLSAFLVASLVSGSSYVSGQEIKKSKKSEVLTEIATYAAGSKKIKDGVYKVVDANNKTLVTGYYRQNKKAGIWNYLNPNGVLVQRYDYTNDTLLYNNDADNGTIVRYSFEIPDTTLPADTEVTPPVKVGGNNYGFFLLYETRQIPMQIRNDISRINAVMNYEFTVGPDGKLENWDITYQDVKMDKELKKENLSIRHLPEDAYTFIPAKLDGKPVRSKLIYTIPLIIEENNTQKTGGSHNMMTGGNQ
ncbi:MAG: hypothetical protein IT214_07200 [Chitinophagaceae bacterium]|nr:hypothetical protein [Chitinophagaceae bacterium]